MSTLQHPSSTGPEAMESSGYFDETYHSDSLEHYTPFSDDETVATEYQDEDEDEPIYEVDMESERSLTDQENETGTTGTSSLYTTLDLARRKMQEDTFRIAMNGYQKLKDAGALSVTRYLTICDFSQPATEKRMYIIDIPAQKILFQCKVSHGKNSVRPGDHKRNATLFSNRIGSNQSSLGFYVTSNTYQGKHGLSLVLEGKEESFNANARRRRVVVHGAKYVREDDGSPAGLSWGCPAIDMKLVNPVINTIKGGSCLFIFARDPEYLERSALASAQGIISAVRDIASSVWQTGSSILSSLAIPGSTSAPAAGAKTDPKTMVRIRKYDEIIERVSKEYKINPNIVRGIIAAESGGNPRSGEGRTGYKGLMQADRGTDQFDPETSIRKGIEKFNQFKGYLKAGLSRLKINYTPPDDEAYAQMVLACYNAGHVTVIKAVQYAHQAGNGRNWLQPQFYQRALLFSGGYDYYSSCTKDRSAAEIQKAKEQGKAYRYDRNRHWALHKDPPPWTAISTLLSPVLACWIKTKMGNTPGYLNRFITYFKSFSAGTPALQSRETPVNGGEFEDQTLKVDGEEFESPEQLYGPEYFDSSEPESETEGEGLEEFIATGNDEHLDEQEAPSWNFEMDIDEQNLLAQWEQEHSEEVSEPIEELAVAKGTLTVPALIGEDTKVPSYTFYVRIPLGKGNYPLDKTGIFIPENFTPARPVTIILYLHGMTGTFPGPAAMIDKYWEATRLPAYDFRLREEINRANRNMILISPSLGNSPNAYKNSLSNSGGGLDNYLTKAIQAINHYVCQTRYNVDAINLSKLVLAAHSAGGSQMRKIATANNPLFGGKITECWGFDSLYGGMSVWLRWASQHPDKKLFIYYKSSTQGNSLWLKTMSKKLSNVFVMNSSAKNHYLVPKEHLRERIENI